LSVIEIERWLSLIGRCGLLSFSGLGRHAGNQDLPNLHGRVRLAMSLQSAVVLTAAKVLDVQLGGGVLHHACDNSRTFEDRLADEKVGIALAKEHAVEFDLSADLKLAKIQLYHVPFLDTILMRSIFEHSVHVSSPLIIEQVVYAKPPDLARHSGDEN